MPVVMDDVRKLATVELVRDVIPIENADAIERVIVRNWTVVSKKGEFAVGDKVVYFEVDSALPVSRPEFAFLAPRGVRNDMEHGDVHVLKTVRLRGVFSQGLVLSADVLGLGDTPAGTDVTSVLGIGKWEAPIPVGNGQAAGGFLTQYARKTDSERIQNLGDVWDAVRSNEWVATEKIDGTSCTVVRDVDGVLRVMGRNWEIAEGDNTYWNVVNQRRNMFELLVPGEGVQMEIAGPGINGNRQAIPEVRPFIFDMVRDGNVVPRDEWYPEFLKMAAPLRPEFTIPETPDELIAMVDGIKSVVNPQRLAEGIVFHTVDGHRVPEVGDRSTFKAVSNKYLSKEK